MTRLDRMGFEAIPFAKWVTGKISGPTTKVMLSQLSLFG